MYYKYNRETLTFDKVNIKLYLGIPIILFIIIFTLASLKPPNDKVYDNENIVVINNTFDKVSTDKLIDFVIRIKLEHPDIVLAQAEHESANYSSAIFRENNNMLGMKPAERRITLNTGVNRGHATFNNWKDCILDYAFMQASYARGLSREQYKAYIFSIYAEDPNYKAGVMKYLPKWTKLIKERGGSI